MLPKDKAEQSADSPQCAPQERFGSLDGCMVEGDAEQRFRERRIRRWSLAVSIAAQSVLLVGLVIAPLFGKTEKISYTFTPLPPYAPRHSSQQRTTEVRSHAPKQVCSFCAPNRIPPTIVTRTSPPDNNPPDDSQVLSEPSGREIPGAVPTDYFHSHLQPPPPPDQPKRVRVGHIELAMLMRRVEPVYPILARQTGRSGRVELRAIIATDGSIKSLAVVEGDPFFVQSALDAVGQWHYKPTILNGQPVEVDTQITVIYSIPR
jgi:protein TonB